MERTWIKDTSNKVGATVRLNGWAKTIRTMGDKLVFIDLRDGTGVVQVVCYKPEMDADTMAAVDEVKPEYVLEIEGLVKARGAKQINKDMLTGEIEISIQKLIILNKSETPPFELDKDTGPINEELRLKYRYLDLRSDRMQDNLRLRDKVIAYFRNYMHLNDFVEIETPILIKGTPEGAREFIVPSRLHEGKFYVLPQSPQQYKQLLMVAGFERYYQVARCFRDEDQRGDRQPEFTQLDYEMSFVDREDVLAFTEKMFIEMVEELFPDKKITAQPFPRLTYAESMAKYGSDKPDLRENKEDPDELAFAWVLDFPMFEKLEDGTIQAMHHPFCDVHPEDKDKLDSDPLSVRANAYDLVLNGYELSSGSIRIHEQALQKKIFEKLGISEAEQQAKFGHLLEAFTFGAPPHGGFAPGLDRIIMILAGEGNIREVMAFPKTGDARDPMAGAPSELPQKTLDEAHIQIKK